jgi:hypothetical protein
MMIVISVIITGLVVTMAWAAGLQVSTASARAKSD